MSGGYGMGKFYEPGQGNTIKLYLRRTLVLYNIYDLSTAKYNSTRMTQTRRIHRIKSQSKKSLKKSVPSGSVICV